MTFSAVSRAVKEYPWRLDFKPVRVIDADTIEGLLQVPAHMVIPVLDMDFNTTFPMLITVRIEGIDAPEDETPEGKVAKAWVQDWSRWAGQMKLATHGKREKYGRWLGDLRWQSAEEEMSLAETLLSHELAVPYPKPKVRPITVTDPAALLP